jgi:hypothetical protein
LQILPWTKAMTDQQMASRRPVAVSRPSSTSLDPETALPPCAHAPMAHARLLRRRPWTLPGLGSWPHHLDEEDNHHYGSLVIKLEAVASKRSPSLLVFLCRNPYL